MCRRPASAAQHPVAPMGPGRGVRPARACGPVSSVPPTAIGLPAVRPHELRHTGATLAAATGATTKELMRRLGHSSPTAALLYQHAADDRDAAIARALDAMLGAVQDPSDDDLKQDQKQ